MGYGDIRNRETAVHTGCCVCISSAGRQCPGAGSGLPSSPDGGGACQFVEPRARASCWALRHLYDGLTFHRVIPNFMCQFGCPNSANPQSPITGTGGPPGNTEFALPDGSKVKRDGGGNIPDELVGELSNEVGTISMANTGAPNSGGSQFFLNTKHNAFLDYFDNSTPSKHPVFGKVVEGMEVIKEIEGVPTDGRDKPLDAVRVETITIEE